MVEVPNDFTRDWIDGHFLDVVSRIAHETAPNRAIVRFTVGERVAPTRPTSPQPEPPAVQSEPSVASRAVFVEREASDAELSPKYTFDLFVIGSSNRFAHAAALAVAEAPAQAYNPPGSTYEGCAAAEAVIEFDAGVRVQYLGTMGATRYEYSLWIEGERGDIWTDRKQVRWRPKGRTFFSRVPLVPVPKGDERPYPHGGTIALLDQFRDALRHGKVPETNAADNLWTLAMVDASIASDAHRREVQIGDVFTPALRRQAGLATSGNERDA